MGLFQRNDDGEEGTQEAVYPKFSVRFNFSMRFNDVVYSIRFVELDR
jgi:hypothetical protein